MIEVAFKGERKEIYNNPQQFPFMVGDYVVVEAEKGQDLGIVNQLGAMLKRKNITGDFRNVIRKATPKDFEVFKEKQRKEFEAFKTCRQRISDHNLDMKLVDVEIQFDGNKITFYFTADKRVDFRELVKSLAAIYKVRIELRQIGVRDEAKRIGGYGSCGRKLCCTTFIKEFAPITTQCAKEQNMPLNPQKLSGLCGRLLCCLMYEREFYLEQSKKYPELERTYQTPKGIGKVIKADLFGETVTLAFSETKFETFSIEEFTKFEQVEGVQNLVEEDDDELGSEDKTDFTL
jgi:cell fate regulator YaaT (PSP1 superfamily)